MSFDEYVDHISQKYRIAIAISVIKTKPEDLSIDEYLAHLQRKIKDMEFDPNETVCSDDFNFDDDEFMDQNHREIPKTIINVNEFDCKSNKTFINNFVNEDFQDDSQNSQTILNDFVFGGDVATNDGIVNEPNLENSVAFTSKLLREATDDVQANDRTLENHQNLSQLTYCESQEPNKNNNYNKFATICYNIANNNHNNAIENNDKYLTNLDSQKTELYSLDAFTQNYTHVSQTQNEPFIISDKLIRGTVDKQTQENTKDTAKTIDNGIDSYKSTSKITEDIKHGHNLQLEYDYRKTVVPNEFTIYNQLEFAGENENEHDYIDMETQYDYNQVQTPNQYEPILNIGTEDNDNFTIYKEPEECINIIDYTAIANGPQETNNKENYIIIEQGIVKDVNKNVEEENEEFAEGGDNVIFENNFEENNDMEVDEKTDSEDNTQVVKVPFKVLEELQRVKAFLNKKDRKYTDGYSTDSGYRSDSQIRGSLKSSSQSSAVWINQSAHCLFSYIMEATTGCGIINEISQVLGQLIDKLHDEENYPPFLEELLETVDSLIRESYENDNWAEDTLITKDETTHRLTLLNKSKHILKHSIENIAIILEKLHINLIQDSHYELTHTTQIENTCYIFHILEIFLKRYIKLKANSSQISTQNSQDEDRFPKRSSLTELWRKKWNPDYKEMSLFQENVTVCVLKKCSEILNKIIVGCMDGYSLVSFAALQCFNLIQV